MSGIAGGSEQFSIGMSRLVEKKPRLYCKQQLMMVCMYFKMYKYLFNQQQTFLDNIFNLWDNGGIYCGPNCLLEIPVESEKTSSYMSHTLTKIGLIPYENIKESEE